MPASGFLKETKNKINLKLINKIYLFVTIIFQIIKILHKKVQKLIKLNLYLTNWILFIISIFELLLNIFIIKITLILMEEY